MKSSLQVFIFIIVIFILFTFQSLSPVYCQTWEEQTLPSGIAVIRHISAIGNIAWAEGIDPNGNSLIIKTTNAGQNWTMATGTGFPYYTIRYLFAVDENIAMVTYTSGGVTVVCRTSNGGVNWAPCFIELNGYINGFWIKTDGTGFMEGDPVNGRWSLWKTTNFGATWDSTGMYLPAASGTAGISGLIYSVNNRIWFLVISNGSYKLNCSSDFGLTWSLNSVGSLYMDAGFSPIWFSPLNNGIGYLGITFKKTTDFGSTWTALTGSVYGITSPDNGNTMWRIDNANHIYTGNGNGSWTLMYTAPSMGLNHIIVDRGNPPTHGYAIRGLANTGPAGISHINLAFTKTTNNQTGIPSTFTLCQNFPNPFNPVTSIKYSVSGVNQGTPQNIKLIVYDIMGKEIKTLVNEKQPTGFYEVKFNASNLSSGVYYYRLHAGNFDETKKMVVMK